MVSKAFRDNLAKLCAPYARCVQRVTILDTEDRTVRGVVQLYDYIYIVCDKSNVMLVYQSQDPFHRLEDITVKQMRVPNDIAACATTGHLYITDWDSSRLWRVKPDCTVTADHSIVKWIDVENPCSVSVAEDAQVLVTRPRTGQLYIYSRDGVQTSVIPLSDHGMEQPNHAVQMSSGTWIVCHDGTDDGLHRVCEVSRDGSILDSYGGRRGRGSDQLYSPMHVLLDKDGKHILVADYHNYRVVVLVRQPLRLQRVLLDTSHSQPVRLCLVPDTGHLLVGMCGPDRGVHIYNLTNKTSSSKHAK